MLFVRIDSAGKFAIIYGFFTNCQSGKFSLQWKTEKLYPSHNEGFYGLLPFLFHFIQLKTVHNIKILSQYAKTGYSNATKGNCYHFFRFLHMIRQLSTVSLSLCSSHVMSFNIIVKKCYRANFC